MPVVGIDYLPAVTHAPGMGRYARELVRALAPMDDRPELRLFDIGGGRRSMAEPHLGLQGASRLKRHTRHWPRRAVAAAGRLGFGADRLLGGVDIFHRTLPFHPPVTRAMEVLPVAELPPLGTAADYALATTCRGAGALVVFCEHYRGAISARYDIDPAKLHLTPVGCEHWARQAPSISPPPGRPVVLALGAIRHHRSPGIALEAFETLRSGGLEADLLLVGNPGDAAGELMDSLARSPYRESTSWISEPCEADMPVIVSRAAVLLHLSRDEGSPVTPLEAFSFGLPVVTSDLPAFREALGDEARYVPVEAGPQQVSDALAAAISTDTPQARDRRIQIATRYTWETTARSSVRVWQGLLGIEH